MLRYYIRNDTKGLKREKKDNLGSGGYGSVYKYKIGKKDYAVKNMEKKGELMESGMLREIDSLTQLQDSKHIVKLYEIDFDVDSVKLVLELGESDLSNFSEEYVITPSRLKRYAKNLCQAVYDCNQKNIIHRDIKPDNSLVIESEGVKISDFGLARSDTCSTELDQGFTAIRYTIWYRPPEVLLGLSYTEKADIWALGMTIISMLYDGYALFTPKISITEIEKKQGLKSKKESKALLEELLQNFGNPNLEEWRQSKKWLEEYNNYPVMSNQEKYLSKKFPTADKNLINLLSQMMQMDPMKRPNIKQVLEHPYFDKKLEPLLSCEEKLLNREFLPVEIKENRKRLVKWLYEAIFVLNDPLSQPSVFFHTIQLFDLIKINPDYDEELYFASCWMIASLLKDRYPISEELLIQEFELKDGELELINEIMIDIIIQLEGGIYITTSWDFLYLYTSNKKIRDLAKDILMNIYMTDLTYDYPSHELTKFAIECSSFILGKKHRFHLSKNFLKKFLEEKTELSKDYEKKLREKISIIENKKKAENNAGKNTRKR